MSSRWHKEQGEVLSIAGKVLGIAGKSSVELRMAAGFGGRGKQGLSAGPRFAETMEFVPT
jgi:hypothetical protein